MRRAGTSKVLVLYSGGTIGMAASDPQDPESPLAPQGLDKLRSSLPGNINELEIEWTLDGLRDLDDELVPPLDSSDVSAIHWQYMVNSIGKAYDQFDGFVILHGTDTMAFTASALSFMLVNLGKPVVVTGSQLPLSDPRSDGVANLVNSLLVAGYKSAGLPLIPEVVLVFADVILRGNRARKMSSTRWRAFESPNFPPLGQIGQYIRIDSSLLRPQPPREEFSIRPRLSSNVIDIGMFPGMSEKQLDAMFNLEGLQGVVLRTFGSGNAPRNPAFLGSIGRAVARNLTIVNVTQCPEGRVEDGLYESNRGLVERGVLSGLDLTPEAALTKLMSLLGNETPEGAASQMQIDQAGEMSEGPF